MKKLLVSTLTVILFFACSPKNAPKVTSTAQNPDEPAKYDTIGKPLMGGDDTPPPVEYNLQEPVASSPDSLPVYHAAHTFEVDLIHEKVEISFDWAKTRANGKATLTMKPWFYPTSEVTLDAKNFDIHSVSFDGQPGSLKYDYDNQQLTVHLGKTYTRDETFKIVVDYTAKPEERASFGGSAAITSDKGLYFINPDGSDKNKPREIWTQGETESNSFWMPTIDKPNERCTQEMYITVDDKYKTLSNGLLISSTKNANGTRTDYWRMDKPHAPYLFMMAVGDYAVVKDKWRGIDVDYYVEPKFEKDARAIFPNTPEMLEFFSNKLNYPFPWPKFSQIVVRDYVSGAMENTTAVVFGEFMQKTARELMTDGLINEKVSAHELFHHWFGDLVTTESWANITLNEGFANYSEYLWLEHKHGQDVADDHLLEEQQGYLYSAAGGGHPLIDYGYHSREDMFDATSYNKGGCILHMLRNLVGDDAFFTALNHYLKKNEYTAVEADKLRMAFEDVTGQDLHWFFNQWYFSAGHPILDLTYGWDETAKKASVTITQSQSGDKVPNVFDLPLAVDVYEASGKAVRHQIRMTKRSETFYFDAPVKPALINVDATKTLLCAKTDHHTPEEWVFQYRHAPLFCDHWEALEALQTEGEDQAKAISKEALQDKTASVRQKALSGVDPADPEVLSAIERMAESDPDYTVRTMCLDHLAEKDDPKYKPLFEKGIGQDQPYNVLGASIRGLAKIDPAEAANAAKALENVDNDEFTGVLADLYGQSPNAASLPFFNKNIETIDGFAALSFFDDYRKVISGISDPAVLNTGIETLKAIAMNLKTSQWRRFAATKAVFDLRNQARDSGQTDQLNSLNTILDGIKANETDPTLKQYYDGF